MRPNLRIVGTCYYNLSAVRFDTIPLLWSVQRPVIRSYDKLPAVSTVHMTDRNAQLRGILGIGHATSMRGAGISMREALKVAGYAECRPGLTAAELRPLVADYPELIEQWLSYSEDKRTDGGWYIRRDGKIGRVQKPGAERQYATIQDAIAEYVVLELDVWAHIGDVV